MIQSIMLAVMGFIAASLLALLIAPAFWSRAVRLTSQRLRSALPLSEQEIRADKDLLRAEYALKVHQLEREVEQGRLAAHRQQIEINRRDIEIRRLSETLAATDTSLSEHRNARSVLEQTVTERIPLLEASLAQARNLLDARDAALQELQDTADRQAAALEDGRAILTQRALEVQRLQALFQEASAHGRDLRGDVGSDSIVWRAEIESLKARLAERAAVIDRLQGEVAARPRAAPSVLLSTALPDDATPAQMRALVSEQAAEIASLRKDLAGRQRSSDSSMLPADDSELAARHLQSLEAQLRSQADEIARLRTENDAMAHADDPAANAKVRESKVWLRSRIERIEGDLERERESANRLRAELAAANERAARQSAKFRTELGRQTGRLVVPAREILRDTSKPASEAAIERNGASSRPEPDAGGRRPSVSSRARELQRALQGEFGKDATSEVEVAKESLAMGTNVSVASVPANTDSDPAAEIASESSTADGGSRGRLLDRLKSYEQA